jgi:hypothetical protein
MKKLKIVLALSLFVLSSCEIMDDLFTKDSGLDIEVYSSGVTGVQDIFFVDKSIGYAVGLDGMIKKTSNGGQTWISQESGTTLNLTSVFFFNNSLGFATGEYMTQCSGNDCNKSSVFLKTINGGQNWTKEFKPGIARFYDLWFFNQNDGVAILMTMDSETFAATTNDGGDSWNYLNLKIPTISFLNNNSIEKIFVKDNICYLLGDEKLIYKSADLGKNWDSIQVPIDIEKACFVTANLGFITDNKDVYKTMDRGDSWEKLPDTNVPINLFHFFDQLNGFNIQYRSEYIGGDFPTAVSSIIYHTSNGGKSWDNKEMQEVISGYTCFPTNKICFCINENKTYVLKIK